MIVNSYDSITSLANDTIYEIKVEAVDESGNKSAKSLPLEVTFGNPNPDPVPVSLKNQKTNVYTYPNPVSEILNIQSDKIIQALSIWNLNGQVICSLNIDCQAVNINVSTITPGLYFVKIALEGNYLETKKVVIQ